MSKQKFETIFVFLILAIFFLASPIVGRLRVLRIPAIFASFTKKGFILSYERRCDDLATLTAKYPDYKYWNGWWSWPSCNDFDHYLPQIYSPWQDWLIPQTKAVLLKQKEADRWVLGPNECKLENQCNATALEVAQLWKKIEDEFLPLKAKLIFANTDTGHPDFIWDVVSEFQKKYKRLPHIDAFALHVYVYPEQSFKDFITAQINKIDTKFNGAYRGKNVWVTEYAGGYGSVGDDQLSFMKNVNFWLENNPRIDKYFWFASRIDGSEWWGWPELKNLSLFAMEGSQNLTPLGKEYAEVNSCSLEGMSNSHGTSPLPNGDKRFLCWDGTYYYCGRENNQWGGAGVVTVSQSDQRAYWYCNGSDWESIRPCPLGYQHRETKLFGSHNTRFEDPRLLCWDGTSYYCGQEQNPLEVEGAVSASQGDQKGKWQCDGLTWRETTIQINLRDLILSYGTSVSTFDLNFDGIVNGLDFVKAKNLLGS